MQGPQLLTMVLEVNHSQEAASKLKKVSIVSIRVNPTCSSDTHGETLCYDPARTPLIAIRS